MHVLWLVANLLAAGVMAYGAIMMLFYYGRPYLGALFSVIALSNACIAFFEFIHVSIQAIR